MLVGERHFGIVRVEQANPLMAGPVHGPLAEQRFAHTQTDRHIRLVGEREELVDHAPAQRHVSVHAGDANGLQFRRTEQKCESQAVVDVSPDVGVEQNRQWHGAALVTLPGASLRACQTRAIRSVGGLSCGGRGYP